VRWAWIVALPLAASPAQARPAAPADPSASEFWREVIEPHGAQVAAIVAKARVAIAKAGESSDDDEDDAIARRAHYLDEAYGMLRYARRLSPDNPDVLSLLGITADELGKTRQAIDALETCVRAVGPERAGTEVTGRLGMIDLRLGKLDDAVHWLGYVQNPLGDTDSAVALVDLATALAARGDMARAIDTLANAVKPSPSYLPDPATLVSFALAVHYDRDEQRAAAFEVIDHMQAVLQLEFGPNTQRALDAMRFAPAEDQLYYEALLYEAQGDLTEARAEWALYAAIPDAPWRRRALDHVAAIDAQRAQPRVHAPRDGAGSAAAPGRPTRHLPPVP
jgi:tetratricopeptide (TPR) repeat protein